MTTLQTPANKLAAPFTTPPVTPEALGVSFIVPMYNEQDNVRPMLEELTTVGKQLKHPFEIIVVDDGSKDETVKRLQALLPEFPELRVVCLKRNFGQTPATAAGFAQARGQYIVTLDGDLQNDPSEVPKLIDMMDTEEVDIIQGWRQARKDNALMRKLPSAIANWLIAQVTGVHVHDNGCSLKVYKAAIAKDVPLYGEMHRFIPALASIDGAIIKEVPVQHRERNAGTSKYGIGRTFKVLLDLMTVLLMKRFFTRPIHLFGRAGMLLIGLATVIGLYLAYQKFWLGFSIGNRPLFVLDGLIFLTGVQLVSTGLIAEIQVRTYYESQQKPIYKIKSVLSVDNPTGQAL